MNKWTLIRSLSILLVMAIIYSIATANHNERAVIRNSEVSITPDCQKKLNEYDLQVGDYYVSPYITKKTGKVIRLKGYTQADVYAIQRGCNIVDDYNGWLAEKGDDERWSSTRYVRTKLMNCNNCHRDIGDHKDKNGDHILGSMGMAVSWTNSGDQYDRYTGILQMPEFRYMQCSINSMNGFKPNVMDDIIRDFISYGCRSFCSTRLT